MTHDPLMQEETEPLARIAAMISPASEAHGVPAADDPEIFEGILAAAARDPAPIREALNAFSAAGDASFLVIVNRAGGVVAPTYSITKVVDPAARSIGDSGTTPNTNANTLNLTGKRLLLGALLVLSFSLKFGPALCKLALLC